MLNSTTKAIAKSFGYEECSTEEAECQYPAEVNYNKQNFNPRDASTYPKRGSVCMNLHGILLAYWIPLNSADADLEDWYDVPTMGEMESMCLEEAYSPAGDCVEPDHPDSWPSILGVI